MEKTKEEQAKKFLNYINDNYDNIKKQFTKYCYANKIIFNEDIFSDTYLKIYDKIIKSGIKDDSAEGMLNYFFKSFKMNIIREAEYARNKKIDKNIQSESLHEELEYEDADIKIERESFIDFQINYLINYLINFYPDNREDIYLFRLKYLLPKITYKKLQEITNASNVKAKVIRCKKFLMEHVTKEEIIKAYEQYQSEI